MHFQTYAALQGWAAIHNVDFAGKLPHKQEEAFNESDNTVAVMQKAILEVVMAFVMAFASDHFMAVYYSTQSDDWPNG